MANRDLSEDEIADLKEAFSMFDINGDGEFSMEGIVAKGHGGHACFNNYKKPDPSPGLSVLNDSIEILSRPSLPSGSFHHSLKQCR
jgi:hypothetical protein